MKKFALLLASIATGYVVAFTLLVAIFFCIQPADWRPPGRVIPVGNDIYGAEHVAESINGPVIYQFSSGNYYITKPLYIRRQGTAFLGFTTPVWRFRSYVATAVIDVRAIWMGCHHDSQGNMTVDNIDGFRCQAATPRTIIGEVITRPLKWAHQNIRPMPLTWLHAIDIDTMIAIPPGQEGALGAITIEFLAFDMSRASVKTRTGFFSGYGDVI